MLSCCPGHEEAPSRMLMPGSLGGSEQNDNVVAGITRRLRAECCHVAQVTRRLRAECCCLDHFDLRCSAQNHSKLAAVSSRLRRLETRAGPTS